jgi:hypothetical protein
MDEIETANRPRILLLHPPYADYTCPYHSLSYVAAPLQSAGYEVDVLDINVMWFRFVFQSSKIKGWITVLEQRIANWEVKETLSVDEQIAMMGDIRSMAACRSIDADRVISILQGPGFYDTEAYTLAQSQVQAFETLLDEFYAPLNFSRAFAIVPNEPSSRRLIEKAQKCRTLIDDFVDILREKVGGHRYVFCGISAPYSANLVPAMALFSAVAEVFPGLPRIAGGTAIVDIYKYRKDANTLASFASQCDFFYVGEAENGVVQLADFLRGVEAEPPRQAINLAVGSSNEIKHIYVALAQSDAARGRFSTYDWRATPPDYDWIDWSLYLSPERRVNYAPSRGCFWNKCTFCDYGMNEDGPTAPVRTMDIEVAIQHIKGLVARGIRHIYLAADAVSPAFLSKFADALLTENVDISWACQVFLTKTFTPELVSKLERSGMVIASFGLESGSARVLEIMGKGSDRIEQVLHPALQAFRGSRVGLQPLYFYGFPGETDRDRQMTVDLLLDYIDVFSPVSRGGMFGLMSGSMIARSPEKYGLRDLRPNGDEDIIGDLAFTSENPEDIGCSHEAEPYNRQLPTSRRFERPWAGGVDTLHSHLFVERFGRTVFRGMRTPDNKRGLGRIEVRSLYDLEEVIETALIAVSLRAVGATVSLPDGIGELLAETLVPALRSSLPRLFTLEFPEGE